MRGLVVILFKGIRNLIHIGIAPFHILITYIIFYCNHVKVSSFRTHGIPFVVVARGGKFVLGEGFSMNNLKRSNPIGRESKCSFFVSNNGKLSIGKNVGMSSTAIVCQDEIIIEDFVKIGGNTCIYDTDFHSLNYTDRQDQLLDVYSKKTKPVIIKSNVFIGAHSTILKGVTIGENSIVGACSVVCKSIPANEIWAGNPAKFIRYITAKE